jgi:hypothetical protein
LNVNAGNEGKHKSKRGLFETPLDSHPQLTRMSASMVDFASPTFEKNLTKKASEINISQYGVGNSLSKSTISFNTPNRKKKTLKKNHE